MPDGCRKQRDGREVNFDGRGGPVGQAPENKGRESGGAAAGASERGVTVSVIVPVHNGGETFKQALSSLSGLLPAPDELIVVADGSTDGSADLARQRGFEVIELAQRGGPAVARNAGAEHARGEILFFVDADAAPAADAVKRVKDALSAGCEYAAVFGSYDDEPAAANFFSQYKNLFHHYVHQTGRGDAFTFWAGCGAVRRDLFVAMGGFDERYRRPSIEDIELGYRLKAAGHRILLNKGLQVKHLKAWTAASLVRTDFFGRALPWTDLIMKRRGVANDLNLSVTSRASVILVFLMLASLGAGAFLHWLVAIAAAAALALGAINAPVYRFFLRKRGAWFALRAAAWHWFYYFYGGVAFGIGFVRHVLGRGGKEAGRKRRAGDPRDVGTRAEAL